MGKRRWMVLVGVAGLLAYLGGYAALRRTHRLVRYQSGCVSRAELPPDRWRAACSDLRLLDARQGPSASQIAYAPLIAAESRLRAGRADPPALRSTPYGYGHVLALGEGCILVAEYCGEDDVSCEHVAEKVVPTPCP